MPMLCIRTPQSPRAALKPIVLISRNYVRAEGRTLSPLAAHFHHCTGKKAAASGAATPGFPLQPVLVEKDDPGRELLAGKSTLNRLELTLEKASAKDRYKKIVLHHEAVDRLLVDLFLQAHGKAPEQIILDVDATDDPLYGKQEGCFFHGYYGHYCYLPLYIFCGEFLLCARLRSSNIDAASGSVEELQRMVQIRAAWPQVRILVRGDSGFCREELMAWCEGAGVDYLLGLAKNDRLKGEIKLQMAQAQALYQQRAVSSLGSFMSSLIGRAPAGNRRGAWWPRRNIWKRERTLASWLPLWRHSHGLHSLYMKSITVPGGRW